MVQACSSVFLLKCLVSMIKDAKILQAHLKAWAFSHMCGEYLFLKKLLVMFLQVFRSLLFKGKMRLRLMMRTWHSTGSLFKGSLGSPLALLIKRQQVCKIHFIGDATSIPGCAQNFTDPFRSNTWGAGRAVLVHCLFRREGGEMILDGEC